jgi:nitroimidazol reductase NimA-like FMN-containing flavoprotein (pyridoxamine 5'-phosphate oxidase superfamily)
MQTPPMSDAALEEMLSQPLVGEFATLSRRGEIRITPIWYRYEDGSFLMNTWENTAAVKNIKANPRCSLMIDRATEFPYYGVHYWGTATVEGPEDDEEGIARLFAPYRGDLDTAREYARVLIGYGKRIYVRFRPDRKTTWDFRQG